jgi:hypothetical protein
MFNLEQAIAEWRERMLHAGIKPGALLDELESHLRDEVEHQSQSGSNLEQSFQCAVDQIGRAEALHAEFRKLRASKADNMNHNRIYTATLWVFAVYNAIIITCGLYYWRVVGQTNEPMGRYPVWALKWMFALTCVYTVLIVATLVARRKDHAIGERLSRVLNWLMLAAIPGGTVIGLYGLFFVDKEKPLPA